MNELVERLRRDVYGNLTLGAIERADLDGMAFAVEEAIAALEAADRMERCLQSLIKEGNATLEDQEAFTAYRTATQKKD